MQVSGAILGNLGIKEIFFWGGGRAGRYDTELRRITHTVWAARRSAGIPRACMWIAKGSPQDRIETPKGRCQYVSEVMNFLLLPREN